MAAKHLSRRLGLALFRLHVENGIAVAFGMVVVGVVFLYGFDFQTTVLAYTGALCASVVDQPSRFSIKPPIFAGAVLLTSLISLLAALCGGSPILLGVLVAGLSFVTALISAYGRRALGLGVTGVLALVLGMSGQKENIGTALAHAAIVAGGGIAYAVYALIAGALLDRRNRRVVLGEVLRAFANYLRAKAALFDPAETHRTSLRALIEAHGVLTENLQTARDMIYAGRMTPRRLRSTDALTALIDCFEQLLSSDADIEILRRSSHRHLMRRMRAVTVSFADDVEALIIALANPRANIAPPSYDQQLGDVASEIARLSRTPPQDSEEEIARAAFQSTHTKFVRAVAQLNRLAALICDPHAPATPRTTFDLSAFMQQETTSPRVLLAQFTWQSATMRYAIRLSLAMTAGYAITLFFPNYVHGGWILLTTALIMRANYSITRQRRNDRVLGTLLGCIIAAALIHVLPGEWPLAGIVIAVGISHAFGAVNYRVTALAASVSALLLIHFMYPTTHPLFFERILDTLIGAALATAFSFLLPSWERRNVPQLVGNLIKTGRMFAEQALTRAPDEQTYRLARRNALDAVTLLNGAARRLIDEPNVQKRQLVALNELLSADYLLASDLASVRTALRARAQELDATTTDEVLSAARAIVLDTLILDPDARAERPDHLQRRGLGEMPVSKALPFLRRRLLHIERSARNVAALAARASQR